MVMAMAKIGLNTFDPNTFPMDAFSLEGTAASLERLIGLKAPWKFNSQSVDYPKGGFVDGRGWWIDLADGTRIQRYSVVVARQTLVDANIGTYGWSYYGMAAPGTWTFPVEFLDTEVQVFGGAEMGAPTVAAVTYNTIGPSSQASVRVNLMAVGRWKA